MNKRKKKIIKFLGAEKEVVLCDMCDRGFHTFCCDPPLKKLPHGKKKHK